MYYAPARKTLDNASGGRQSARSLSPLAVALGSTISAAVVVIAASPKRNTAPRTHFPSAVLYVDDSGIATSKACVSLRTVATSTCSRGCAYVDSIPLAHTTRRAFRSFPRRRQAHAADARISLVCVSQVLKSLSASVHFSRNAAHAAFVAACCVLILCALDFCATPQPPVPVFIVYKADRPVSFSSLRDYNGDKHAR